MWLRSEKRSSRIAKSPKSQTNLRKLIKNAPILKNLKAAASNVGSSSSRRSASLITAIASATKQSNGRGTGADPKLPAIKCNIKGRASVKRLNRKANTTISKRTGDEHVKSATRKTVPATVNAVRRKSLRNIADHGKENCWQDDAPAMVTDKLADATTRKHRRAAANRPERLNDSNVAQIDSNLGVCKANVLVDGRELYIGGPRLVSNADCERCRTLKQFTCNCSTNGGANEMAGQSTSGADGAHPLLAATSTHCVNYIECDSTTDTDRNIVLSSTTSSTVAAPITPAAIVTTDAKITPTEPEIDSTTDLILPSNETTSSASSSASSSSSSCLEPGDPLKLQLPTQGTAATTESAEDKFSIRLFCTQAIEPQQILQPIATTSAHTGNIMPNNFATTPDLITLFDEEMNNKSTDMCQYSDLFPYNNCMTSAFLGCSEANTLAGEQTNGDAANGSNDLTFFSSINQTAIDNLKALTNLHSHSSNFLSNITLPKSSYGDGMTTSKWLFYLYR